MLRELAQFDLPYRTCLSAVRQRQIAVESDLCGCIVLSVDRESGSCYCACVNYIMTELRRELGV